jgi:HK97 family phage major capsid protein
MNEIQDAAGKAGQTKDAAQQEEFDTLAGELLSIDKELKDLATLETLNVAKAVPAIGRTTEEAAASRSPAIVVRSTALPPGVRFARVARIKALAMRTGHDVEKLAAKFYPDDFLVAKAVAAGSTDDYDGSWAKPLVGEETNIYADFAEFLRPQTVLGKFGVGNIPSLLRVPFRVPLLGETSGGSAGWVGEGKAKPLTKSAFERRTLVPMKVANIAVVTEELLRSSAPSADILLRNMLARALQERLDIDFINPDKAIDPGVSPASITNGATPIPSSGNDADAVRADLVSLIDPFIDASNPVSSGVWIMSAKTALRLGSLRNALGQREFPEINMAGGTLEGMPVITSEYVPTDSDGAIVVLLNAGDIYLGDDNGVAVDISREASLEMSATPSHDSITPTAAQLVSMFQTNSVAFRAERTIDWMKRRAEAVQYLSAVNWGQAGS